MNKFRGHHLVVVAGCVLTISCASSLVGTLRFKNQPPVWEVNDRRNVPHPPSKLPFSTTFHFVESVFYERIQRILAMEPPRRALNINSLGEVPNSTWFTNRIGVRKLTPQDVVRGPNRHDGPDLSQPLKIVSTKLGGAAIGFVAKDSRGDSYILKFDVPSVPLLETGTDVIVQRLLWACGYNVPENSVVNLDPGQFVLAKNAKIKDAFGRKRPLTSAKLEALLDRVHHRGDGTIRALASLYLPGVPLGGFPSRGVRADDINDTVPHQHRRELRGLYVFFSWLQNTDVKPGNTLDVWTQDPSDGNRHFVVHYLIDFGKALGASRTISKRASDGYREAIDFRQDIKSIFALGLWKRPWEKVKAPNLPGVGYFDARHYHPGSWRSHRPYLPFAYKDKYDMFWAAKIMMRLTPAHVRAAVLQGRFDDSRSVEHIVRILIARQRKTARHWFARVNPIDRFRVKTAGNEKLLCFTDLMAQYKLDPSGTHDTSYHVSSFNFGGDALGTGQWITPARSRVCAQIHIANDKVGYTIVRIVTRRRSEKKLGIVEVHLARNQSGQIRIIGVNRR